MREKGVLGFGKKRGIATKKECVGRCATRKTQKKTPRDEQGAIFMNYRGDLQILAYARG